ncbi:TOTE conflict system archaeo-eukaryotic primase domain-containing protein [Fervidibacillus halotolerans]|uniref:TOTE conflict system primase domain-containing protein n=1 Tax=Fervidibacillus halotolerans TaxID=2980027 RepID=A0A9E8RY33_9BACI|nr:hypothetical protein [Fervidibacillus halotolerans]WAA13395.1 hypothetical protein OE105_04585 [Fervidibacillus halotolerans]
MKTTEPVQQKQLIKKFNTLYIQTRKKYLVQFAEGQYATFDKSKNNRVIMLNDSMLKTHLAGELTYGVFNGGYYNKFITFDVDYSDNETAARWTTFKLIDVLVREFNIPRKYIHASQSGNKGYHVDLFFDRPIALVDAEKFYNRVMAAIGELPPGGQIEFRPSWTQGVKLPLGVHQRTGNRCWFVDNETLEPVESFDYLLTVEPMDANIVLDAIIELTEEQQAEFDEIVRNTDTSITIVDTSKALRKAARILEAGRLTESGTRHNTTFTLACFFNSQGFEQDEAVEAIMEILRNTPRDYFSKGSTPEFWLKETKRLVKYVYEKDIQLGNAHKEIKIYKSEILEVLKVGTFRQKQLAYAMLVTSKRYGKVFYLTVNTAMKMIDTTSRQTVQNAINKLIDVGFIEYVRKGELDVAKSKETGRAHYKPNKYRLLINEPPAGDESIKTTGDDSLIDVAYKLCRTDEIKKYVKRREFDNRWAR